MDNNERIILGSADVYIVEFTGKYEEIPDVKTICVEANRMAYIQGGATIEYKPSFYEAKDDTAKIVKSIMTDEEVTLKTGIMTFNGNKFKYLSDTARVTEVAGKRTVKIGGISNRKGSKYAICLHHTDAVDGDIYILVVGNNQAGFSLSFAKDKETVVDAEIKAHPMDGEGTLIYYEELEPSDTTIEEPEG
ncbi:hypothetical protein LJC51_08975 [Lachnospiraceae bacterium OttesenSCG-928-J05]|nr:hypothetical protein [Lachnospiraceae bacterium OttesenSCG-928-J05]